MRNEHLLLRPSPFLLPAAALEVSLVSDASWVHPLSASLENGPSLTLRWVTFQIRSQRELPLREQGPKHPTKTSGGELSFSFVSIVRHERES